MTGNLFLKFWSAVEMRSLVSCQSLVLWKCSDIPSFFDLVCIVCVCVLCVSVGVLYLTQISTLDKSLKYSFLFFLAPMVIWGS